MSAYLILKKRIMIGDFFNFLLARMPHLYETILRWKGNYNFEKLLFLNLVKNGHVVFDIGANRGYYTLLFSHLVGRNGEVHAFEPVPTTFNDLSKTIINNTRFDNVYLNNTAVGEANCTTTLYLPEMDDGQASMKTHYFGSWANATHITTYECSVIKLDDYGRDKLQQRLDFVKCDIEGAELLAFRGFYDTITKYSPIVYLEICPHWTKEFNYQPLDLVNFLISLGYKTFYIIANNTISSVQNTFSELTAENLTGSVNLLCIKPELHLTKLAALLDKENTR